MNHASLFSGIGGAEVAASMMGWQNLFHCEIQEFPRKVLDYWFPNSESYEDITKTDFTKWHGKVDVLTGGFPCQPFSLAGRRKGADDNRYLWPQMLRAIRQIHPTWVVGENVNGIKTMVESCQVTQMGRSDYLFEENYLYREESRFTLDKICADLEAEGYSVQPIVIPACAIGAPHRRDRVWILPTVQTQWLKQCNKKGKTEFVPLDLLPTPNAMDMEINYRGRRNPKREKTDHSLGLEDMAVAKLLPTPCSIEATKFTKTINPKSQMGQGLTALAVNGLLPTPTAMEVKHSNRVKGLKEQGAKGMYSRKNGALRPNGLTDFLDFHYLLTPMAADGMRANMNMQALKNHNKEKANLSEQIAHKVGGGTSQLNPLFVEEMMGFPLMWTALPFLSPSGDKNP